MCGSINTLTAKGKIGCRLVHRVPNFFNAILLDYNRGIAGIDLFDQMVSYVITLRIMEGLPTFCI